jgi:1,6-anhydro-N-acetylmuramate kinase
MTETWLPVPGFEGAYEVSDLGRVRSLERIIRSGRQTGANGGLQRLKGRVLKTPINNVGYKHTQLGKGHTRTVHDLVLRAFVGPPPIGHVACHNDGVRHNCVLSNLRWDTQRGNMSDMQKHGTRQIGEANHMSKLTSAQVLSIRNDHRGPCAIARDFGVNHVSIIKIKRRETWKHI